jgi:glycosyltransferase involved in cell wall biosynthesis
VRTDAFASAGRARAHLSVCICTYRRPHLLAGLLRALDGQETDGRFTYSIVVVDNDHARSAEAVVGEFAASSGLAVRYQVEPRQNIARARNKAIESARGDLVAFIDDDECPPPRWLVTLFLARQTYGVDGVLGPVRPRFAEPPPAWVVDGKFYERPTYPTGFVIDWRKGRTGNVLLRREALPPDGPAFRPEFLSGEDQDFFRRMIARGRVFIWCDEAAVHEEVPPVRWRRRFMLKRALLRGAVSLLHPTFGVRDVATSLLAVVVYTAVLPATLLLGQAAFMTYLVKLCDHLGRLLALLGFTPIRQPYVSE